MTTSQQARARREASGARARRNPLVSAAWQFGPPVVVLALIILAWEILPPLLGAPAFIFPQFSSVIRTFGSVEGWALILPNAGTTLLEAVLGFLIGSAFGVVVGFVLAEVPILRRAFYPVIVAIQALPKVAVAPLFVVWFGFGMEPKILLVALLTFFPVFVNTMAGVSSVDPQRLELFRSLCAGRAQAWRKLLLPSAAPSIFAGLEIAVVFSLLGAIVGEFVSASSGLGVLLQRQQANYDTAGMFAVLIVLSVMGVLLSQIVIQIRRRVVYWDQRRDPRTR